MIRSAIVFPILLLAGLHLQSQPYPYPKNTAALEVLREELHEESLRREIRVQTYLNQRLTESRAFVQNGKSYFLHDVVNGQPLYLVTHNEGSARSMGLEDVRPGGKFGLAISGAGVRVGVWDAGIALRTHQEYTGRLLNNDSGTDVDDHACHVVGTLIAAGVEPKAKGMLYAAQASAYDWNQDYEEMITESLEHDLLVSNHSYGYGTGWENGVWRGDQAISNEEDYRFGFYDSRARSVDAIAFNAPYYSIFKSAGNDRGDSGNGPQPTDGPYDCIGDWGVAKNVFTIGAVRKLSGTYGTPADIVMSGFSSWGPVDDGRIKPDVVAPGVNIYSSISTADDAYGNLSGTSMASPSAAGAVTAINEAHRLFHNTYLRSSTLKALVIQTAFEAGNTPGPDYSFGWGMINVSSAVDLISKKDGINSFIIESSLLNRDSFVLELDPVANEKITATLAWTDPPGTPTAAALDPTTLMLVNDLDMRIVNEVGNTVLPWILDPSAPGKAASRGDNFRDNVEKIEFANPQPRKYFLVIKHKGDLKNGKQDFGLVVQYKSENTGLENLYWVNNTGQWSDNGKWSKSSGGSTANLSPQSNNKLIFDNNSFSTASNTVTLDKDYEVAGIVSLNNKDVIFDLAGHTLTVSGSVIVGATNFTIKNGTIVLRNPDAAQSFNLDLHQTKTSNLKLQVAADNAARWIINGNTFSAQELTVSGGLVAISNSQLTLNKIAVDAAAQIQLSASQLTNPKTLEIGTAAAWTDDFASVIRLNNAPDPLRVQAPSVTFNATFDLDNTSVQLSGAGMLLNKVDLNASTMEQLSEGQVYSLIMAGGSSLRIAPGQRLDVLQNLEISSNASKHALIQTSGAAAGKAAFGLLPHQKFCFDYLEISNVDLEGAASVSVGTHSTLTNAEGWFDGACNKLLFANFDVSFACAGSLAQFIDNSDGDVAVYQWYVDDEAVGDDAITEYVFEAAGNYRVRLEISDADNNQVSWEKSVAVIESAIPDNRIIQNTTQLASFQLADSYQWYRNGEPIPGATGRVYLYNGEKAVYFVVTYQGDCNKQSEVLDLLGTDVRNLDDQGENFLQIYPVPARNVLYIRRTSGTFTQLRLSLFNAYGQEVYHSEPGAGVQYTIDLSPYSSGIYLLVMDTGDQLLTKKVIKHD